jgi:polar amino acid transport system permease protein
MSEFFSNLYKAIFQGQIFKLELVFSRIPEVLKYLPITLEIAITATLFSLVFGFLVALVKVKDIPVLRRVAQFFVSFMRGTPVMIQLYATYFGIPMILKALDVPSSFVNKIPPIIFSVVALALNDAAYSSEAIRAAIQAVDKGQIEAAHSIGMTGWQTLRRITIPESLVIALPSLGNGFIGMIKATSLVFVTAVVEMSKHGQMIAGRDFRQFEMQVTLAIIYWVITMIISRLLLLWERKLKCNERNDGKGGKDDTVERFGQVV